MWPCLACSCDAVATHGLASQIAQEHQPVCLVKLGSTAGNLLALGACLLVRAPVTQTTADRILHVQWALCRTSMVCLLQQQYLLRLYQMHPWLLARLS